MDSFLSRVVVALVVALCVAPAAQAAEEPTGGALAQVPTPTPTPTATPEAAPVVPAAAVPAPAPKAKKVTVKQIQKALGFKRPDGIMGPKTKRAIKRFQRKRGLRADGVPRRATLIALGLQPAPQPLALPTPVASVLTEIAECESGGDPTAVSSTGKHRGKYQFTQSTWEDLGGIGDPAEATEPLQDTLAAQLYAEQGLKPWPACGRRVAAEQRAAAKQS